MDKISLDIIHYFFAMCKLFGKTHNKFLLAVGFRGEDTCREVEDDVISLQIKGVVMEKTVKIRVKRWIETRHVFTFTAVFFRFHSFQKC